MVKSMPDDKRSWYHVSPAVVWESGSSTAAREGRRTPERHASNRVLRGVLRPECQGFSSDLFNAKSMFDDMLIFTTRVTAAGF
jgi:hypothetical protein